MARTLAEIQEQIIAEKENKPELAVLTSTSKTSIWRLMVYIVAVAIWTLEQLFDTHRNEVSAIIRELKPHTLLWYRNKAKAFQYGFPLIEDTDKFDNTGYDEDAVAASKIVKYSAVTEAADDTRLIVKIATEDASGVLSPITSSQETSFKAYMQEIKDAGIRLTIINYLPDNLIPYLRIFRDPLVIDQNGVDIRTGSKPVEIAIKDFLKALPFNGEFIVQDFANAIEKVEGVEIVQVDGVESWWVNPIGNVNQLPPFQEAIPLVPTYIDVKTIPVSGYFEVVTFDNISYVV